MCVCLLYWRGYFATMAESLDFFAKMRTEDMDGVSIPSQRRHCMHFEQWRTRPGCSATISPAGPPLLRLQMVRLDPAPKNIGIRDIALRITMSGGRLWRGEVLEDHRELDGVQSKMEGLGIPGRKPTFVFDWSPSPARRQPPQGAVVCGDTRVEVMRKKQICRFWLHTAFVEGGRLLRQVGRRRRAQRPQVQAVRARVLGRGAVRRAARREGRRRGRRQVRLGEGGLCIGEVWWVHTK